jgi:hypothetical protein
MKKLLSVLIVLSPALAHADNEVIGTIQLSLEGDEQTWYVLESPSGLRPNALWMEIGPNRSAVAVTAFESPYITLVPHEMMESAVPDSSAPALVVSIGFTTGASEETYSLPIDQSTGPAVVMLLNDWSNPIDSASLSDGPGEIKLTEISASKNSASSFSGTFSGALTDGEGNTRIIESGQFEFEKVSFFERP